MYYAYVLCSAIHLTNSKGMIFMRLSREQFLPETDKLVSICRMHMHIFCSKEALLERLDEHCSFCNICVVTI